MSDQNPLTNEKLGSLLGTVLDLYQPPDPQITKSMIRDLQSHLRKRPEDAAVLMLAIVQAQTEYAASVKEANDAALVNAVTFAAQLPPKPHSWTVEKHGFLCAKICEALGADGASTSKFYKDLYAVGSAWRATFGSV